MMAMMKTPSKTDKKIRRKGHGTPRKDGRWEVRVSVIGFNGVRKLESVYGKTQKEAQEKASVLRKKSQSWSAGHMTLSQLRKFYEETDAYTSLKPASKKIQNYNWKNAERVWGDVSIRSINRVRLSDWLNSFTAYRLAQQTRSLLRLLFAFAVDRGWVDENPVEKIVLRSAKNKRKWYKPTSEEVQRITQAESPLRDFWTLLAESGLRPWSEAIGLTSDDLYWSSGSCWIYIRDPKTHAGVRVVAISEELGRRLSERKGYLFPSPQTGRPYSTSGACKLWREVLVKCGVSYTRPYELRHYVNRQMLIEGVSEFERMRKMGHSRPNLSLTVYAELPVEDQIKVFENRSASKSASGGK